MPDLQSPAPAAAALAAVPFLPDTAAVVEDADFAFGCECADPSLQIAQWGQEPRSAGAEGA